MTMKSTKLSARLSDPLVKRLSMAAVGVLIAIGGSTAWRVVHSKPALAEEKPKAPANHLVLAEDASQLAFLKMEPAAAATLPASDPMNAKLQLADDLTARIFPPLGGRVISLQAAIGDKVAAGAPLAVIDAPDFGQAIADLRKAEADVALKNKALARSQTLFDGEVLSRRELEASEADAHAARAESERARLRLANLAPAGSHIDGQRLVLRAPLAGYVVDRQANPGTEVRPDAQNPLFVISNLQRLWLTIDLPEKAAALARPGADVHFAVDAYPGVDFSARIDRVGAMVDPNTRRIPVRAVVDNADGRLKPEMYARATVSEASAAQAIRLPVGALLTGGLGAHLFIQTGPREFERRPVAVARQDAEFAYLTPESAVKPGDKVVVRGALLLASELAQGE
ncbi:MAG TPA: efflux RND transporter periplasmic adaptor subunit [Rhodocyclaceae bacterium]|nr:efflux RND transporter periplasmic adaptor subunit [Rhodocyclaceae bacterium]